MTSHVLNLKRLGDTPSLNDLGSWARLHRQMKNVRDIVYGEALQAKVPKRLDLVAVELVLHLADRRRQDADNLALVLKASIDGLRAAGVLADDDHTHVAHVGLRIASASPPRRWVLHITELEPEHT